MDFKSKALNAEVKKCNDTRSDFFWSGVRAELPLLLSTFPFGLIYGALALRVGISPVAAQAMSSIIFAGAAQIVTSQLVLEAAPVFVIVLTVGVINLRHLLYSASIAPYLQKVSVRWKMLLSYLLTDEAYAPSIIKYEKEELTPKSHLFLLGAGIALWITWQVSTALGILLGAAIPESWQLDFALPLSFIAMVVPVLKNRPAIMSALSAGIVALLTYSLPYKSGLILAALVGIVVGTILEGRK